MDCNLVQISNRPLTFIIWMIFQKELHDLITRKECLKSIRYLYTNMIAGLTLKSSHVDVKVGRSQAENSVDQCPNVVE